MPRTTSITIVDQLDVFVNRMIEDGRYGSTSEVVRSALRLLEQKESQLAALKKAVMAGEGNAARNYAEEKAGGTMYKQERGDTLSHNPHLK
jgi:antitoxin ParD1/3/4